MRYNNILTYIHLLFAFLYAQSRVFPGDASGKEPTCQCRRHERCRLIPRWGTQGQLTPVFLPGESHGQRSLEGYSP